MALLDGQRSKRECRAIARNYTRKINVWHHSFQQQCNEQALSHKRVSHESMHSLAAGSRARFPDVDRMAQLAYAPIVCDVGGRGRSLLMRCRNKEPRTHLLLRLYCSCRQEAFQRIPYRSHSFRIDDVLAPITLLRR